MQNGRTERWLPLTGAAAVVLTFIGFATMSSTPDTNASATKIVAYYTEHRSDLLVVSILAAAAGILLLFFAAALRSALAGGEGGAATWSSAAFAGAIAYGVGALVNAGFDLSLHELPKPAPPLVAQSVHVVANDSFMLVLAGSAVLLLASGAAILRGGALPRWLGWVALVLGVLNATPVGFFGFLLGMVWILVVSILLVVRGANTAKPARDEAPPVAQSA